MSLAEAFIHIWYQHILIIILLHSILQVFLAIKINWNVLFAQAFPLGCLWLDLLGLADS